MCGVTIHIRARMRKFATCLVDSTQFMIKFELYGADWSGWTGSGSFATVMSTLICQRWVRINKADKSMTSWLITYNIMVLRQILS